KEAIEMVNATAYDLVLMDIQMPDLNGYETTAHLRQLNYNSPIVALSANAYEEDVQASLAMGMNDHITKPYTEEHLFEKIQELMEGKQ
ncbi:MAG: hybrid sensor histidine kinase/response regulator, partial [Azospira oryzae]